MRAGKVASLFLMLILSGAATAASSAALSLNWFHQWNHASHPLVRLLVLWCIFVVVVSIFLLPLGIVCDRTLSKLRDHIDASAETGESRSPFVGLNWLTPVTSAFTRAIERFQQR